ncbi:MAG: zinc-dependent metalloprotease, partial [Rubrivivax sp.]|nr:zinc-dependent metalloprotease [Rubrivivax sp.]
AALEWNKAFERAGFRNALSVEQQPADAEWTTLEGTRLLAVRWFAQDGPGSTAVGPSQSDPRTGEILRGAAIIDENRVRVFRARATEVVPRLVDSVPADFAQRLLQCNYADEAMDQAQFGFELLVERGQIDPSGPDAERYISAALKDVTMHEIGHALGLRHNFRASTSMTAAQLRDRNHTREHGLSSSVMDYNGQNLPLDGEPVTDYNMTTLGAYDHWAIEYGYREFADAQAEKAGLQALAARSEREPALAYATDEDLGNSDPLVNQRDMSNEPLQFAQRQLKLSRELWQRTTTRKLAADEDLGIYRRALSRVLGTLGTTLPLATKYVGGTYTARAKAGADQPLLVPVPAAQQRAALDLVVAELFASASFKFDPRVMSRLGIDQFERSGPNRSAGVDFSLPSAVLALQRSALDTLMSDNLAGRLADAESKVADPRQLLSYAEVQERLHSAVWTELGQARTADVDSLRRNLQREHLKRLTGGLLRAGSATVTNDVRPVHRQVALQLQSQLQAALASRRWSTTARAHLDDSLALLNEALKAPLIRQGV